MPPQALYRKWRPQLWEEVVGQEHVVQTLRNALRGDRVAHAYLFAGPRGCGKTTTARLIAKALNCLHPDLAQRPDNTCDHCQAVNAGRFLDLIEIDGASNNSVENIRELRDKINFAPTQGRQKIYIVDEVHMLSTSAFNALLKTLEEPPAHAVFILATTESHKIPATVASRCQRFDFRRIPQAEIVARLQALCEQEGLAVEAGALEAIARQATGSLRDAISLLDQLADAGGLSLAQVQALLGSTSNQVVPDVAEALARGDARAGLDLINQAVDSGADPRQMARQVVDYLRGLMLAQLGSAALVEVTPEARAILARQAGQWEMAALLRAIRAFNAAANDTRGGWQPQLPLELAVVECTTPLETVTAQPGRPADPAAASPAQPEPEMQPPPARPARRARAASAPARPEPPAAPAPEAPQAAPPEAADPAAIKDAWEAMIRHLQKRKKITALTATSLRQCWLDGWDAQALRVFTRDNVFFEKVSSRPDVAELMGAQLSEVLGFACSVKFQLSSGAAGDAPDVPPDGMVAAALRELGGEIVDPDS